MAKKPRVCNFSETSVSLLAMRKRGHKGASCSKKPKPKQKRKNNIMSAIAIAESVNASLVCKETKSGAMSWKPISRKAFSETSEAQGLKGRALKKAHWDYLQRASGELNAAVSSEIASGRIVITGVSSNAKGNGGSVKFELADHFARHEATEKVAKKMTETDAFKLLEAKYGVDMSAIIAQLKK